MLRNLASSLILTERETDEFDFSVPKVKGRVITTIHKAKEVRPLVEKCVTIARKSLPHAEAAAEHRTSAERNSSEWKQWRQSEQWQKWCDAQAPVVAARRRALQLLGDKQAVAVLFDVIAPRFADRDGGYTRILRLAKPRVGDAGTRAILEFVGVHDRRSEKSEKPAFSTDVDSPADESPADQAPADDLATADSAVEEAATGDNDVSPESDEKKD